MTFLLDSNALLAWVGAGTFDRRARRRVERARSMVSAVTVWELGHKQAIGKLRLARPVREVAAIHDFDTLDITVAHAEHAGRLPLHHHDPFDRMLVAQALVEGLTIVTRDDVFDAYDVDVLRC